MAAGVMRNLVIGPHTPAFYHDIFQQRDLHEKPVDKPEEREEEEEEEDDEEECSETVDDDDDEGPEEVWALDVTKQLLRFADLISRDVQRYFGSGDQDGCVIYSEPVSVSTSGRLRYYDDLLKIAGTVSGEESRARVPGSSDLGPLAELFHHSGPGPSRGQPMIKRLLPLSFWTEPRPCCSIDTYSTTPTDTHSHSTGNTYTDQYEPLPHQSSPTITSSQPDFSDLLANWDPEIIHTH
ncbi:uncharacterized protein LOC114471677 [Gouania willdenowi]|uniref:uncharacterized protein LOC114471656 n=1 Tax=Gouania willdenowi TaxID=441366 RepID=UPI001055150E|nr:uncharacterized protein LOC114471656 [Gouania willdenowi]XP_028316363.1 uncharacterized protein LOC114471677 [Gouania willdenowi]